MRTNPKIWYYLGLAYYERGITTGSLKLKDFDKALTFLKQYLAHVRVNTEVAIRIAGALFFSQAYEVKDKKSMAKGRLYFEKVFSRDPAGALTLLGQVATFLQNARSTIQDKESDAFREFEKISQYFTTIWNSFSKANRGKKKNSVEIPNQELKNWEKLMAKLSH
eukprot:TRINITY_DN4720_c0_g1_i3.p1 TRINITY_DN4720_c0_g1~~TRINITY_DN4720_c0_g1_i3.p1  ORF type:complete len:190 (-),score=18.73 TRINITY_DN4720_c0_g1_i3:25-519(-)